MINLYPNLMHIYFNKSFNENFDFNTILISQFGHTYYLLLLTLNFFKTFIQLTINYETYKYI
jgi:hypothetical protein